MASHCLCRIVPRRFALPIIVLAIALAAPAVGAQSATSVWEAAFPDPRSIAASPDGSRVVVGDGTFQANSILFLDPQSGDTLDVIRSTSQPVYPEVFQSPDVTVFDSAGETVLVAHHSSGQATGTGRGDHGSGNGGIDVRRWDPNAPDGDERLYYRRDGARSVAVSGRFLFYARYGHDSVDNTYVRDVDTQELIFSENNEESPIFAAFSPDGTTLATLHRLSDAPVRIRRAGVWTTDVTPFLPAHLEPQTIDFSPDGTRAVVGTRGWDGTGLYIYDTSDWSLERHVPFAAPALGSARSFRAAFSDDGAYVAAVERRRVGDDLLGYVVQLTVHSVETGERMIDAPLTPEVRYARVPPADIKRVPGTGTFLWFGNDRAGVVAVDPVRVVSEASAPVASGLHLVVAPNPAAHSAEVRFQLAQAADVLVTVHDLLGRRLATLAAGGHEAGPHRERLDTSAFPSGMYVVRLASGGSVETQRVIVAR